MIFISPCAMGCVKEKGEKAGCYYILQVVNLSPPQLFLIPLLLISIPFFSYSQKTNKADVLYSKAYSLYENAKYDSAIIYFSQAAEHYEVYENWKKLSSSLDNIGNSNSKLQQYQDALDAWNKAKQIRLNKLKTNNPKEKISDSYIAGAYFFTGFYDESLKYFNKAEQNLLKRLDEHHPDIVAVYNNIARIYEIKCDYDKSIEYYRKTLKIWRATLGNEHPNIASVYFSLGEIYKAKGQLKEASEFLQNSLKIRLSSFGGSNANVASCYQKLGDIYMMQNDFQLADQFYYKNLIIKMTVLGEENPEVVNANLSLANAYTAQGKYDKSIGFYLKCLSDLFNLYDEENVKIAHVSFDISNAYYLKGGYEKSLERLNITLRMYSEIVGSKHRYAAKAHQLMGDAYMNLNQEEKAYTAYHKTFEILTTNFNATEIYTLPSLAGIKSKLFFEDAQQTLLLALYSKALLLSNSS